MDRPTPNPEQQEAINRLSLFATTEKTQAITLVGQGGSGKTFCVMSVVEELLDAGLRVLLSAPTNQAVRQLAHAARAWGIALDNPLLGFSTVHSALGMAMLPDEKRKYAARVGRGIVAAFDVMIVDEASMLSRRALEAHLLNECRANVCRLIFMGDNYQLPPPTEAVSPVFEMFENLRLTKNERAKHDDLLEFNLSLRDAIAEDKPFKWSDKGTDNVQSVKAADFMKYVALHYGDDTDLSEQRTIAWSNKRVGEINTVIREKLYGKNPARFMVGERVLNAGPIKDAGGEIILNTGEECIIKAVQDDMLVDEETGEGYATELLVLKPIYAPGGQVFAHVLSPESQSAYDSRLDQLAGEAKKASNPGRAWGRFWAFKEMFADIRYCYCITAHRAQGASYSTVFVDVKDMLRNPKRFERQRLLYVGVSRARTRLVLNKNKFIA